MFYPYLASCSLLNRSMGSTLDCCLIALAEPGAHLLAHTVYQFVAGLWCFWKCLYIYHNMYKYIFRCECTSNFKFKVNDLVWCKISIFGHSRRKDLHIHHFLKLFIFCCIRLQLRLYIYPTCYILCAKTLKCINTLNEISDLRRNVSLCLYSSGVDNNVAVS